MKALFPGYYRPTKKELSDIWNSGLFIFDANVLLNLYRYSHTTSSSLLTILQDVSERLWIPYQVAWEYQHNRLNVISEQVDAYSEIKEFLQKHKSQLENRLREYQRHPIIDVGNMVKRLDTVYSEISSELELSQKEHPDLMSDDVIHDTLTQLFQGKVGSHFSSEILKTIFKEGEERFKANVPPGYMDAKKEGGQKFGDLVLWFQLIEKAKVDKKSVIFVTDDTKEDWWWKFRGKIMGPHPKLVEEFAQKVGASFYMYSPDRFMKYAQEELHQPINREAIEEIKSIRQLDNILLERYTSMMLEMKEVQEIAASIDAQITELYPERERVKRTIELRSATDESTIDLAEHYREIEVSLKLDSLVGVREEHKRKYKYLKDQLKRMEQEYLFIQKLSRSQIE